MPSPPTVRPDRSWFPTVARACRPIALSVALAAVLAPLRGTAAGPALRDYRLVAWTTTDGLPQNNINDIVVLPDGELWLATFGGLVRFDGTRFEVFDIARRPELTSNRISAIAPAGGDALWYVTQEGDLGRVEGSRIRTMVRAAETMPDVLDMAVTASDVYARMVDGSIWISDGRQPWRLLVDAPPADTGEGQFIAATSATQMWASLARTVMPLSPTGPAKPHALPGPALAVSGGGGHLWLGMPGSVARYRDGRLEPLDVRPALDYPIGALLHVSDSELWVAGGQVVSHLTAQHDGTWARADLALNLPAGVVVRALAFDGERSLWVGTNGRGLLRANRQPTQRFAAEDGLEAIAAMVSDGGAGAWLSSTSCAGVFHIGEDDIVRLVQRPDDIHRSIASASDAVTGAFGGCGHSLAPAPGGDVWVRWNGGIYRVGRQPSRVSRLTVPVPAENGPIVPARDGTMWVVSQSGDVRRVSGDRVLDLLMLPGPLTSATLAPDDTLWVGGAGEAFQVGPEGLIRRLGAGDGVPRGPVRDVLADADGDVWIATYGGGLGRWRKGWLTRLTVNEGLPDNSISRILDDGRGRLWLATNRGLAVLTRADVEIVARGLRRTIAPVVFGPERGVPEATFGVPAGFAAPNGRLWFGTIDGAVRIDASRFPFNAHAPALRIDSVMADDRALDNAALVRIPPDTARVRFNFSARGLLHPDRIRFRFRIEGIDKDWVDVGAQRFVTFTPSSPGRHRFLLQASNEDGVWNRLPLIVELDVLPAWWQRPTTRVVAFAAVAALAFALYRRRVATIEQRHAERVRALEDRRRTEEQAAALRAQLEHMSRVVLAGELAASLAHEVNQPLTAIVANAEAGEHILKVGGSSEHELEDVLHDIVTQGMRASEVIQGLREFLRTGHPATRPLDLSQLVHEMLPLVRREFEDCGVRLQLELREGLPLIEGSRVQLGQIVINLLLNACEVLAHVDGVRLVTVETRATDDRVELLVQDNGPGPSADIADRLFDPFVTTKPAGMGMGLTICRSIAEQHRGWLTADVPAKGGLRMTLSLPAMAKAAPDAT